MKFVFNVDNILFHTLFFLLGFANPIWNPHSSFQSLVLKDGNTVSIQDLKILSESLIKEEETIMDKDLLLGGRSCIDEEENVGATEDNFRDVSNRFSFLRNLENEAIVVLCQIFATPVFKKYFPADIEHPNAHAISQEG
jgi:hypothetical protein